MAEVTLREPVRRDVEVLWKYHDLGHELRPCDIGIGLGSHDPNVAGFVAELYHRGLFPRIVFTGANAPSTVAQFPRGEAVHYAEAARRAGVPSDAILVEPHATNTSENLTLTRALLQERQITVRSVLLVSRPYQQRRAHATCRKVWPQVEAVCASAPLSLGEYFAAIGDTQRVVSMLVGDTQRIVAYARRGFAVPQHIPPEVWAAYERLVAAGYTSRLI